MKLNIAETCLSENARRRATQAALIFANEDGPAFELDYQTLERETLGRAAAFRKFGLVPGDRILLRLRHGPEYALCALAALAGGFVLVPASPMLTARELGFLTLDSSPTLWVRDPALPGETDGRVQSVAVADLQRESEHCADSELRYADVNAEDPALLIYTSGATGTPKGVLHAQRMIYGREPMLAGWSGLVAGDRMLHAGALNWTYSLGAGLLDPLRVGATAMFYAGPSEPERWPRLIHQLQATIFAAIPSLYRRILKYGDHNLLRESSLRHALTAGEALAPELLDEWRRASGRELYEALGMTEISTYISSGPAAPVRPGSPGKPQPGRRVVILSREDPESLAPLAANEVGLLAIARDDPGLMLGYWNRPDATQACFRGEWFIGGDLASLDEDGYVHFHGRADELMNASGYRVAPLEVERRLAEHPAVAEVAVKEVELRAGVRVIAAFVVLRADQPPPDAAELLAFAGATLAGYKCPRVVYFRDALPHTANGKVQKAALAPD